MADRELLITLKFAVEQAEQMAAQWHANERARIRETANSQDRADRDAARRFGEKMLTHAQMARQLARIEADAQRAAARWSREQARQEADADRDLTRKAFQDRLVSAKRYSQEYAELAEKTSTEAQKFAREAVEAAKRGDGDAARSAQRLAVERSKLAKEQAAESQRYAGQAIRSAREATESQSTFSKRAAQTFVDTAQASADGARRAATDASTAAKGAATEIMRANEEIAESAEKPTVSAQRLARAYAALSIGSEVAGAVEKAWKAAAHSLDESRNHVHSMVEDMERMRSRAREILAMRGERPTAANTAGFAAEAAAASVKTEDYARFTEELQAQIQGHIQPDAVKPGEAKNYRLTQDEATSLSKFAVSYAASQGIDPRSAAQLMGSIVATAAAGPDGKVNEAHVREQFAKIAGTLQTAKGRTSKLMPQFAEAAQELSGEGGSVEDLKKLAVQFSAESEVNPGKSSTLLRAMYRGLRQVRMNEEKSASLGITRNMSDEQALDQMVGRIPEIAKAEGVGENEVVGRYMNEIREFESFRAHVNRGIRGGLYERGRARQDAMSAARAEQQIMEYQESPEGVSQRQSAEMDRARFERASLYENLTAARRDAGILVTRAGEVEAPEKWYEAVATQAGAAYGQGKNRFEQETERIALGNLNDSLAKYEAGREFLSRNGGSLKLDSPEPVKARGANLLARLRRQAAERGARGLPKESPGPESFRRRARELAMGRLRGRGVAIRPGETPEQFQHHATVEQMEAIDREANAIMTQAAHGVRLPARREVTETQKFGPGDPGRQVTRPQSEAQYGWDIAQALASHGDPDRVMKGLRSVGLGPATDAPAHHLHVVLPPGLGGRMHGHERPLRARGHFDRQSTRYRLEHLEETRARIRARSNAGRHGMASPDGRHRGDWFVDERGRLRHGREFAGMSLEDYRRHEGAMEHDEDGNLMVQYAADAQGKYYKVLDPHDTPAGAMARRGAADRAALMLRRATAAAPAPGPMLTPTAAGYFGNNHQGDDPSKALQEIAKNTRPRHGGVPPAHPARPHVMRN